MPDITMCKNKDCPLKDKCYRFTAEPSMRQFYFTENPSRINKGKFECSMFWGDSAQYLLEQLKSIYKHERG